MRKLVFLLVLAVFFVTIVTATAAEPQKSDGPRINWETSMDRAIEQAKAQNKLILMDFFNPQ